jgi:hypothetical protein
MAAAESPGPCSGQADNAELIALLPVSPNSKESSEFRSPGGLSRALSSKGKGVEERPEDSLQLLAQMSTPLGGAERGRSRSHQLLSSSASASASASQVYLDNSLLLRSTSSGHLSNDGEQVRFLNCRHCRTVFPAIHAGPCEGFAGEPEPAAQSNSRGRFCSGECFLTHVAIAHAAQSKQ